MTLPTPPRRNPAALATATVLIVLAIALPLVVPIYARSTPKLGDFPFFYWYQLILVPVIAILCACAYLLLRSKRTPATESPNGKAAGAVK
jgi:cytochrome bd-type quinol oxidase subunit 2